MFRSLAATPVEGALRVVREPLALLSDHAHCAVSARARLARAHAGEARARDRHAELAGVEAELACVEAELAWVEAKVASVEAQRTCFESQFVRSLPCEARMHSGAGRA